MTTDLVVNLEIAGEALRRVVAQLPHASPRETELIAAVGSRLHAATEAMVAVARRRLRAAQDVPAPASFDMSPSIDAVARDSNVAPTAVVAISSTTAVGGGDTDSGASAATQGMSPFVTAAGAVDLDDQAILFDTEGG
jgi:hypothetical protein